VSSPTGSFAVYGFETTHDALIAERKVAAAGIGMRLIPTPPSLGVLCGLALRVRAADAAATEAALRSSGLSWSGPVTIEDR